MRKSEFTGKVIDAVPAGVILLGLTPALMVLLLWDFGNDVPVWRELLRYNSLVVPMIEFAFIFIALGQGFSPVASIKNLSALTKTGTALLSVSAIWTTVFVAAVPATAILGIGKYIAHFLFGLALLHQLGNWSAKQRYYIWPIIGIGLIGYCVLLWINITFYHPIGDDWLRLVPAITNIRWIGFFALASFCAAIGMLGVNLNKTTTRWRLLVAMVFATVGLTIAFWSGTRAAVVAIAAATILTAAILPVQRQILFVVLVSTVIAILITLSLPVPHPVYGIERMLGTSNPELGGEALSSNRLSIWAGIIDRILERPIMGWGIDQLRYTYTKEDLIVRNAHQGLLQLLVSTGLFGLVAYLCFATRFVQSISRSFSEGYQFAALAFLTGAIVYGLYDGFFYFTYPVMILLVATGCLVNPPKPASDTSD